MKWLRTLTQDKARSLILLGLGTAGAVNELFLHPSHNPTTAALIGALLGLPLFLGKDEKAKEPPPDPEEAYLRSLLRKRKDR